MLYLLSVKMKKKIEREKKAHRREKREDQNVKTNFSF